MSNATPSGNATVGIITAEPITTLAELESAYQQAVRGRHISEIAPILALRNKALEAIRLERDNAELLSALSELLTAHSKYSTAYATTVGEKLERARERLRDAEDTAYSLVGAGT